MSTLKVDAIRHNSATSDAITTAADGTCTAKLTSVGGGQLSHRNVIVNGGMTIAQRATSSTSNGYQTMDRWYVYAANHSVTVTTAQVDITSGNAYDDGFRKAAKISLSGAGTLANNTEILLYQKIEAQDLANSGWNYKSASSNITLSFWVKSSTAQAFAAHIRTEDGTAYLYSFTYTVAQANVWQKITKTIAGNSNITINDDNGPGLRVSAGVPAIRSDYTSGTADTWLVSSSSNKFPSVPNTWLTAGASTFELTGVQLEVGDTATSFEHRTYQDEFLRCCRYYQQLTGDDRGYNGGGSTGSFKNSVIGIYNGVTDVRAVYYHIVPMRDSPTFTLLGAVSDFDLEPFDRAPSSIAMNRASPFQTTLLIADSGSATKGDACLVTIDTAAGGLAFSAEL